MYKLYEDEEQGGIAINLMPLLAKDIQNKGDLQNQVNKAHKWVVPMIREC